MARTFPKIVDSVVADVEMPEKFCADEQLLGKDGHCVVRQVDALQSVGNPFALGKHLASHKRDVVVAQVQLYRRRVN